MQRFRWSGFWGRPVSHASRIHLSVARADRIRRSLEDVTREKRYVPDAHVREMKSVAGEILSEYLAPRDSKRLLEFGSGRADPVLNITGLPQPGMIPPTPYRGFDIDESHVLMADLLLLGIYDVAKIDPISYAYENYGHIFRNVVPNPDAVKEKSSQGSAEPLEWHTDNPCGPFEFEAWRQDVRNRPPIPRFLGFYSLRNCDASGQVVPTEVLPIASTLARLDHRTIATLAEPEFCVCPPPSNKTPASNEIPLLVRWGGRYVMRFDADQEQVFGITNQAKGALQKFRLALLDSARDVLRFPLVPGQLLIFDNYRVLHQRRNFTAGPDLNVARWLRRCYGCMSLANGIVADRIHQPNLWTN